VMPKSSTRDAAHIRADIGLCCRQDWDEIIFRSGTGDIAETLRRTRPTTRISASPVTAIFPVFPLTRARRAPVPFPLDLTVPSDVTSVTPLEHERRTRTGIGDTATRGKTHTNHASSSNPSFPPVGGITVLPCIN
jgi:hypothetical protein